VEPKRQGLRRIDGAAMTRGAPTHAHGGGDFGARAGPCATGPLPHPVDHHRGSAATALARLPCTQAAREQEHKEHTEQDRGALHRVPTRNAQSKLRVPNMRKAWRRVELVSSSPMTLR